MVADIKLITDLLLSKDIKDILPYLAIGKKETKKQILMSELEIIASTTISVKTEISVRLRQEKTIEEKLDLVNPSVDDKPKTKISYELFIPVDGLERYGGFEIKYLVSKSKETLQMEIREESETIAVKAEKQSNSENGYTILFNYSPQLKGYTVRYETTEYAERIEFARQDFTSKIDKVLDLLPKTLMGGVLGFTYLGSGKMTRRDDLFGDRALMVDVHEAIHTPDEYETRVLTDWILRREKPKYRV